MSRARLGVALGSVMIGLVGVGATLAAASAPARRGPRAATGSGLSVTFRFTQTSAGTQHGQATTGVKGHGTFSAKLGAHSSALALIALATGIPLNQVARGGSFGVNFTLGATGTNTGTVVARFKAGGLGSTCFKFTAKGGQFQQGDSFVPTTGTIKVLGGTGAAARWNATAAFSLGAIAGATSSIYTFSGTVHGKIANARHLSPTCKQVAALIHG